MRPRSRIGWERGLWRSRLKKAQPSFHLDRRNEHHGQTSIWTKESHLGARPHRTPKTDGLRGRE